MIFDLYQLDLQDQLVVELNLQKFEIEVAETKYKADGSVKCFYDPGREKILR